MIDWHDLEIFVTAARLQNFSATAQALHLSQPAITQRIQSLERQLQVKLFERQGRRVTLSEEGAYMQPLAEDLLLRAKRLEELMRSLQGKVVGHLIIGCSTTSGKYVLPGLLARFCEKYPGVRATIRIGSRLRMLEQLRQRKVHFAFSTARTEDAEITYHRFFNDEVVLIAPRDHPWAKREMITPFELLLERVILREEKSGTYHAMKEALAEADIAVNELRTVMTLGNSEAIIMAVEEGIGVGFVPKTAALRSLQLGGIKVIPIQGMQMCYTIWMACNTMHPATAAQMHFMEMVRSESIGHPLQIGINTYSRPPLEEHRPSSYLQNTQEQQST